MIDKGATVIAFERYRLPRDEIEARIWGEGDHLPLATYYHCEACADQFFNLTALGYCPSPEDNMPDLLNEYVTMNENRDQSLRETV